MCNMRPYVGMFAASCRIPYGVRLSALGHSNQESPCTCCFPYAWTDWRVLPVRWQITMRIRHSLGLIRKVLSGPGTNTLYNKRQEGFCELSSKHSRNIRRNELQ